MVFGRERDVNAWKDAGNRLVGRERAFGVLTALQIPTMGSTADQIVTPTKFPGNAMLAG